MDDAQEKWLPIRGFEQVYEISDLGRVRSKDRWCGTNGGGKRLLRARVLRITHRDTDGYFMVSLVAANGTKYPSLKLHRLVAKHFVGGFSEERNTVNHKDLNKSNNRADNLEWLSDTENKRHAARNGIWRKWDLQKIELIGTLRERGYVWREIAAMLEMPMPRVYGAYMRLKNLSKQVSHRRGQGPKYAEV